MNFKKAGIFRRSSEGSEQPEVQNDSGGMLGQSRQWKDGNGGENRKNAFHQKEECYSSALRHDCPYASLHLFSG